MSAIKSKNKLLLKEDPIIHNPDCPVTEQRSRVGGTVKIVTIRCLAAVPDELLNMLAEVEKQDLEDLKKEKA